MLDVWIQLINFMLKSVHCGRVELLSKAIWFNRHGARRWRSEWQSVADAEVHSLPELVSVLEERRVEGDMIGYGDIKAAQFINNGRVFDAIRSQTHQGIDYFSADGLALRKAFIRSPVDFTRISSPFNPHRLHPIFKTTRPHQGVDYAAPVGTEVLSAGKGTVTFVGDMKGYGNTVIIDHSHGFSTLYAHLNGFSDSLIAGRTVKQGEVIAYVGQTGWATGPHLHYEFRINGRHQNPETITIPNESPMSRQELRRFLPYAQTLMQRFERRHSPAFKQALARLER